MQAILAQCGALRTKIKQDRDAHTSELARKTGFEESGRQARRAIPKPTKVKEEVQSEPTDNDNDFENTAGPEDCPCGHCGKGARLTVTE